MTLDPNLDPEDWDAFAREAHAALDLAIAHMRGRADAPVWRAPPEDLRQSLKEGPPRAGRDTAGLVARIARDLLPHDVGNTHPRFFGWVHGAGTPEGVIPEIFACAMNANLGGRDHGANLVEHQVIGWMRRLFGFPEGASGLVVSGTSMATLIALKVARDEAGEGALVGYASDQAHGCIAQAFDILGLGRAALRKVPVGSDFRMDTAALENLIARDRRAGLRPFCVIGSAGTVNTGAIDSLDDLADIAAREGLWLHVDGAFGALAALAPGLKPRIKGIARAQSLAFDFHKWLHVNYDAVMVLIRDGAAHHRAFSDRPDYLAGEARGLAGGNPWFCEFGPELSRGFRALKVWYQLSRFGLDRLGAQIERNCADAAALGARVEAAGNLRLMAPVSLNIVCFRFDPGGLDEAALDALNRDIVVALQEQGLAAPSTTRIDGRLAIRVNITNHRTRRADLEALVADVERIGAALSG